MNQDLPLKDGVVLPAATMSWSAVRSGGPGGQHANTSATQVQVRLDLQDASIFLPRGVLKRLQQAESGRINQEGELLMSCSEHRSRHRNIQTLRQRLAQVIFDVWRPPRQRIRTRRTRGSHRRRLKAKRHRGRIKARRGRVHEDGGG